MTSLSQRLTKSESPLRIHLIGVAGSGMSGLALLLIGMGHNVSGSDKVTTVETERMQGIGLSFSTPHTTEAVHGVDLVVYSSAIRPENPALRAACDAGVPLLRRAECLAAILRTKKGVVVAGTHGKTTTSSMTAHALRESGMNPSYYVGAEIPVLGANARWSEDSEYMIAEGDESDGTLALYHPEHSIILNIEAEHLDYYKDITEIRAVFGKLMDQTRGKIIYCTEDPVARDCCLSRCNSVSYGWSDADYLATHVRELRGASSFDVMRRGKLLGRVELGIPGKHNILNSLAAIALADSVEADFKKVVRSLATFAGAKRRFETKYLSSRFRLVDDYGHHPTELAATLQTAKSFKPRRVVVLFQPHRYSRTQALANDFGKVLQLADRVFVADVYPASETPIPGVSGETIIEAAKRQGDVNIKLVPNLATAHHAVGNALQAGDMLITLGAGNVHEAGSRIASDLKIIDEMLSLAPDGCLDAKLYEPMRRHTTMLVGGPAQYWIEPHTFESFALVVKYCRERSIPVRVIGRGSNLLVRDGGIRGAVIHPCGGVFSEVKTDGLHITAGACVRLKKLANVAAEACIGGFEWMEGIPANVGGSLRMNAGAMGVETFDHVISVTFLDEDGIIRTRSRNEIETSYRNVPELSRSFAMQAVFRGVPDTADNIHLRLDASREKRRTSQPVAASAGCVFKNPAPIPAGKLVDELGMKGTSNGRAKISEIHGNFIVNEGGATTADVLALIERIRHEVRAKHGIELDTEVKILGEEEFTF